MANEITQESLETSADVAEVAAPAKKARQSRKSDAAAATETTTEATTATPAKKTRAKRGSKITAGKPTRSSDPDAVAPVADRDTAMSAPAETDEIVDLMKFEEENKTLCKQLSEKLRAENADLRKRLGQN
jgi:hypothetical protein